MSVSGPSETEAIWQVPARLRLELLALLSADPTKPATMTYDEFLAWADEDTLAEWVDGIARDRGTKFEEYREAGIPEYWLLDPRVEQAEFYHLDERGRYQLAPVEAADIYRSRVIPGLWLRVDWLWQQPLPSPTRVLLDIDRDAYLGYFQKQLRQTQR